MQLKTRVYLKLLCIVSIGIIISRASLATVGLDDHLCTFIPDNNPIALDYCSNRGRGLVQGVDFILGFFRYNSSIDMTCDPYDAIALWGDTMLYCLCSQEYPLIWKEGDRKPEAKMFNSVVGCACPHGYYGPLGINGTCTVCPQSDVPGGPQANSGSNQNISDCFIIDDFAVYRPEEYGCDETNVRNGKRACGWNTSTNSYSDCVITLVRECCPGTYQQLPSHMYCKPVGYDHYGPVNKTESRECPYYMNYNIGAEVPGSTYYDQADNITLCFIPKDLEFADESGTYVHTNDCNYTQ